MAFFDDFNDADLSGVWNSFSGGTSSAVTEPSGSDVLLDVDVSENDTWAGIINLNPHDISAGELRFHVSDRGGMFEDDQKYFSWDIRTSSTGFNDALAAYVFRNTPSSTDMQIDIYEVVSGSWTLIVREDWSSDDHAWMRVREEDGTTYIEAAASEAGPWTVWDSSANRGGGWDLTDQRFAVTALVTLATTGSHILKIGWASMLKTARARDALLCRQAVKRAAYV